MTNRRRGICGGWSHDSVVLATMYGCVLLGRAADPPSLKLFDLPRPQLRSIAPDRPAVKTPLATNAPASVDEFALETKAVSEIDLLVQRHEAMNGRPPLALPSAPRDTSRFQRTLDSLLPSKGAFLQKNPNVLSSPLRMSEYWAK